MNASGAAVPMPMAANKAECRAVRWIREPGSASTSILRNGICELTRLGRFMAIPIPDHVAVLSG
jgi:hypothetical protein